MAHVGTDDPELKYRCRRNEGCVEVVDVGMPQLTRYPQLILTDWIMILPISMMISFIAVIIRHISNVST